jgi:hypothetical protein
LAKREIDFLYTGEPMDADALKARNQARQERSQLDEPTIDGEEKVSLGSILKAAQRHANKEQRKREKKKQHRQSKKASGGKSNTGKTTSGRTSKSTSSSSTARHGSSKKKS